MGNVALADFGYLVMVKSQLVEVIFTNWVFIILLSKVIFENSKRALKIIEAV